MRQKRATQKTGAYNFLYFKRGTLINVSDHPEKGFCLTSSIGNGGGNDGNECDNDSKWLLLAIHSNEDNFTASLAKNVRLFSYICYLLQINMK